ncbi:MAG TPA: NYN domain-containing protein [Ilumatobacter sp.]|nr:NYN domain-containing protein [Ilumatobacter sp.]
MGQWIIDGNNVFGSRPDGWWNDRPAAMARFTQTVAEWCRTHGDDVTLVFDAPVPEAVVELAGGNLLIVEAPRRGRNAADDHIVDLADQFVEQQPGASITVVTSDRGLRGRLDEAVTVRGTGGFRELIGY